MSKLVTSGTGHVSGARLSPGPKGARTPPQGGDEKISKAGFGFKGIAENFLRGRRAVLSQKIVGPGSAEQRFTLHRVRDRIPSILQLASFLSANGGLRLACRNEGLPAE